MGFSKCLARSSKTLSKAPIQVKKRTKMSQYPRNAIVIGPNEYIESVALTGNLDHTTELDPHMQDLSEFWSLLETHCVAGCCGLDAFDLTKEAVQSAAQTLQQFPGL
jgi:hypothetical protein